MLNYLLAKKNIEIAVKILLDLKILDIETKDKSLAELNFLLDNKFSEFGCEGRVDLNIFTYMYQENKLNTPQDFPTWVVGYKK